MAPLHAYLARTPWAVSALLITSSLGIDVLGLSVLYLGIFGPSFRPIIGLVALASRGEKLLFKVASGMVLTKLAAVAILGLLMVDNWDINNVSAAPPAARFIEQSIVKLPFTLTSILFIQSLSPMVNFGSWLLLN